MAKWLARRRDVAVDSTVSYLAPRLAVGLVLALLLVLATAPPPLVAATAGMVGVWRLLIAIKKNLRPSFFAHY
jgi:xanthosine utilization system XapX-like protein